MKSNPIVLSATHARSLLKSTGPISVEELPNTTFTCAGARVLLDNFARIATARGFQLSDREIAVEKQYGLQHLDFLVKLHNLSTGIRAEGPQGLKARIECARHIFTAEDQLSSVVLSELRSFLAQVVFCFGEREFDTLFEMGDGDQVKAALMESAEESKAVKDVCRGIGWIEVEGERA